MEFRGISAEFLWINYLLVLLIIFILNIALASYGSLVDWFVFGIEISLYKNIVLIY